MKLSKLILYKLQLAMIWGAESHWKRRR